MEKKKPGKRPGSPKSGGRVKGSKNKASQDLKLWVKELIEANTDQIQKDLEVLQPYQRVSVIEKLLSYVIARENNVSAKIDMTQLTDDQINQVIDRL